MTQVVRTQKAEAIAHFQYEGRLIQDVPFGNGHINDTYLLTFEVKRMGILKVILQKMNKNVFKNPVELMENILGVTSYLREKIIKKGGDPDRETLNVIPALDGKPYYQDSFGDYWRSYIFITDAGKIRTGRESGSVLSGSNGIWKFPESFDRLSGRYIV